MSGNIFLNTVTSGLEVYMDMANIRTYPGTGTVLTDLNSNSTGNLTNGALFESTNKGCIVFDGINDYATVPIANANSAFTLNIWVKAIANSGTGSTGYMGLVQRFNGYSGQRNRFLLQSGFSVLYFQAIIGGVDTSIISDTFTSIQNQISMCTVTWDGSVVKFFVNGVSVLATPAALTGILDSGVALPYLGWGATSADYYLNGKVYNYMAYNRNLSLDEIVQNYNAFKGRFGY